MSFITPPASWSDQTMRNVKRGILLLGIALAVVLWFHMNTYTVHLFLLYLFLVMAGIAFRMQMGSSDNDEPVNE